MYLVCETNDGDDLQGFDGILGPDPYGFLNRETTFVNYDPDDVEDVETAHHAGVAQNVQAFEET